MVGAAAVSPGRRKRCVLYLPLPGGIDPATPAELECTPACPPSRKDTSIANQKQFARRLEEGIAVSYRLADL
jgi:hypothetical protein